MRGNPNISDHGFKKGQSGNPKGRPRKFVCQLKEQGYKRSEINDTIQVMMSMTMEELKEKVWDNPNSTVMEKTIASAIKKGIERGDMTTLETLLDRVFGKPKMTVDNTHAFEEGAVINWSMNEKTDNTDTKAD